MPPPDHPLLLLPFPQKIIPPTPRRRWEVPFLVAALAAAVWISCFNFPFIWTLTGIGEADKPFLDLSNLLSAGESLQRGLDPFVTNPLDPYHRLHGYTTWWLVTGPLGLTLADAAWLGPIMLGATLASAVWLLRPADWKQGGSLLLMLASPPLLLAASRANHDLVVFVLMCAALACFRSARAPLRALGVLLLAVSAVLKYFPLAAALLLLEARTRREFLGWGLLYALVLVLAWPGLEPGFRNAVRHMPAPSWLYAFGAPTIFRNFDLVVPLGWLLGFFLLGLAVLGWPLRRRTFPAPAAGAPRDREQMLACGAVMVAGCFLHGSSYSYKLLFGLWLLPWLWSPAPAGPDERWRKLTFGLLLATLWFEGGMAVLINASYFAALVPLQPAQTALTVVMLVGQLLAWALVFCLGRALLVYVLREVPRLATGAGSCQPAD